MNYSRRIWCWGLFLRKWDLILIWNLLWEKQFNLSARYSTISYDCTYPYPYYYYYYFQEDNAIDHLYGVFKLYNSKLISIGTCTEISVLLVYWTRHRTSTRTQWLHLLRNSCFSLRISSMISFDWMMRSPISSPSTHCYWMKKRGLRMSISTWLFI